MTDRAVPIRDLAALDAAARMRLIDSLASVRTLEDLLRWASMRRPPVHVNEIVTQDEYTHDVLVPVDPPRWLAFDVT